MPIGASNETSALPAVPTSRRVRAREPVQPSRAPRVSARAGEPPWLPARRPTQHASRDACSSRHRRSGRRTPGELGTQTRCKDERCSYTLPPELPLTSLNTCKLAIEPSSTSWGSRARSRCRGVSGGRGLRTAHRRVRAVRGLGLGSPLRIGYRMGAPGSRRDPRTTSHRGTRVTPGIRHGPRGNLCGNTMPAPAVLCGNLRGNMCA